MVSSDTRSYQECGSPTALPFTINELGCRMLGNMANDIDGKTKNSPPERGLIESLLHYLAIVLRYRLLVIIVTGTAAVGIIAFCVASLLLPPEVSPLPNKYTASATVLVQKGMGDNLSASILTALGIESRPTDTALGFDTGALVLLVLNSRTFLDKVVEEFGIIRRYGITSQIKSRSRGTLLQKSNFVYNRNTAAVSISFEDIDPVFARDVTNHMVALLNEWFAQNMGSSNQRQALLLNEKVKEVKVDMDKLEGRVKELQKKYGVLGAQDLGTSQASALAALRSQLILKEIEIKNYSTVSAIEDPKLQQLRDERQNILDLISQTQQVVPNVQDSTGGPKSLPDLQMEFNNLTVELDVQRKIYNTLSHQYEVLKLTSEPESAFQIMELAEVPDSKSSPSRTKLIAMVTIGAFVASVVLAFLLHSLAQIRKGSDARTAMKTPS
jgi:tyrosine-protein kinase Etk/Wzc